MVADYPILKYFTRHNVSARQKAYVAVLLRSPLFRKQLVKAHKNGVTIQHGQATLFNRKTKILHLSNSPRATYFLQVFPHELKHIEDNKVDESSGVMKFIDGHISNEMRANGFAFDVLEEIGFKIDQFWPTYKLYEAYKKGTASFRKVQKRAIKSNGDYTYVEHLFYTYQSILRSGKTITVPLLTRTETDEAVAIFINHLRNSSKTNKSELMIFSTVPAKVYHLFPDFNNFAPVYYNSLTEAVRLLRKGDAKSKFKAYKKIAIFLDDVTFQKCQRITMQNASRLGLHKYYK